MDYQSSMVLGGHSRNTPGGLRHDVDQVTSMGGGDVVCQICADNVGTNPDGSQFLACHQCAYPVCRACYEYERKEGDQCCPQCKTRYQRLKGSPKVEGDGFDDMDDAHDTMSIDLQHQRKQATVEALRPIDMPPVPPRTPMHESMSMYDGHPGNDPYSAHYDHNGYDGHNDHYPMLDSTPHQQGQRPVDEESMTASQYHDTMMVAQQQQQQQHMGGPHGGMHGQPSPYGMPADFETLSQKPKDVRPLVDYTRHDGAYGYGSIAWKDPRMEEWKRKSEQQQPIEMVDLDTGLQMAGGGDGGAGGMGPPTPNGKMERDSQMMDESRQPLSRKVSLPSEKIQPYRFIIVLRLAIMGFFLHYRLTNPVHNAMPLWITSIVCEIWFSVSWILDQFPKWNPINRETSIERLALRYEQSGDPAGLSPVDIFVSTVDPVKEPILITSNTILSILSMDYPSDKYSCYLSDDGGAFLTFEAMAETAEFARQWVPFARKYAVEPRSPENYFGAQTDYLKNVTEQAFIRDRREMKRQYEEFKVRINMLVEKYAHRPAEGWTMADDTPWPGNNSRDHPGMIQVFLGPSGGTDVEGNPLPRLVYVSREKRPGYNHHKKAGAMNALVRVSAVLTNAPFILNLDCDHYVNNSKALREAMCFMMDPHVGKKTCYVQFPQRFDGIDKSDRYANHNTVFFDINLRGLDGLQGPVYVGTGCCFRRTALYGSDAPPKEQLAKNPRRPCFGLCCCCAPRSKPVTSLSPPRGGARGKNGKAGKMKVTPSKLPPMFNVDDVDEIGEQESLMALKQFERKFGPSPVFVLSTFHEEGGGVVSASPGSTVKEAIHVISCGYEDNTEWGKELGWIYGSVTEDILTGFRMHCRGWRSIYCMPKRPAFKGSAPINLSDRLNQVLRWALGSVEIFLSRNCPIWYGYRLGQLKVLQRLAYINTVVYPFTSFPLVVYCCIPAVCLLTNRFIVPSITTTAALWFLAMFSSIFATGILEMRWSGVSMEEWWRNEQFWVIGGVSAHLYAVFQGLLKVFAGIDTNFTVTSKATDEGGEYAELYIFKYTSLLIPPTSLAIINIIGVIVGLANAINNGVDAWGPLFGKLLFAFWVIVHLYPFLKGLGGKRNRTPTLIIVWSVLLASIFSLLWIKIDPFLAPTVGPDTKECGVRC